MRESVGVIVHTPGSEAGVPIDVLTALVRALSAMQDDPEGLRDYVRLRMLPPMWEDGPDDPC